MLRKKTPTELPLNRPKRPKTQTNYLKKGKSNKHPAKAQRPEKNEQLTQRKIYILLK